jgi:PadR family transcriptional regulator PadR
VATLDYLGMAHTSNELLHGTLETLILNTVARAPRHGYAIARWLEENTADVLRIEDGSLYPALYRMEQRGWIRAEWGTSELGRKAKFYRITEDGRKRLAVRTEEWARFAGAISKVLLSPQA